jgi:hypothetical protein
LDRDTRQRLSNLQVSKDRTQIYITDNVRVVYTHHSPVLNLFTYTCK